MLLQPFFDCSSACSCHFFSMDLVVHETIATTCSRNLYMIMMIDDDNDGDNDEKGTG